MRVPNRVPHLQAPKTTYHRARYMGSNRDVAGKNSIHDIRLHVSPRGRVNVRIFHGYHYEKTWPPVRYYNMEVFAKDWQILRDIKI